LVKPSAALPAEGRVSDEVAGEWVVEGLDPRRPRRVTGDTQQHAILLQGADDALVPRAGVVAEPSAQVRHVEAASVLLPQGDADLIERAAYVLLVVPVGAWGEFGDALGCLLEVVVKDRAQRPGDGLDADDPLSGWIGYFAEQAQKKGVTEQPNGQLGVGGIDPIVRKVALDGLTGVVPEVGNFQPVGIVRECLVREGAAHHAHDDDIRVSPQHFDEGGKRSFPVTWILRLVEPIDNHWKPPVGALPGRVNRRKQRFHARHRPPVQNDLAGQVVHVLTGLQLPAMEQDASRAVLFSSGELGGEFRLATARIGDHSDESSAQARVHIVQQVSGDTDISKRVRHAQRGAAAQRPQPAWERHKLRGQREKTSGQLLTEQV
jgi:hypothetical protein